MNSWKLQRIIRILHNPHHQLANTVKFAYFALNKIGKLQTVYAHTAHIFIAHNYMYDIYLHICRLVLYVYNFTMLTIFYIKFYMFLYQIVQPFQDHCLNSLTPITYQNKISNVVGTQGSIQFICWPSVLHSNVLSLAKSLIGIGTVRLALILLSQISETSCFLGLLQHATLEIQLDLSLFNKSH